MTLTEPGVEVTMPCEDWYRACTESATLAETAAALTLRRAGAPAAAVLDITLTNDTEQRDLNRTWRGKDASTNVLAFPAVDKAEPLPPGAPLLLGDVVLAFETVRREANEQGKPLADHLRHLVVHGTLHLLGYDHLDRRGAERMEAAEIAILAELGMPNPYADTI